MMDTIYDITLAIYHNSTFLSIYLSQLFITINLFTTIIYHNSNLSQLVIYHNSNLSPYMNDITLAIYHKRTIVINC